MGIKLKDIIGATTYWVYGAGAGHYNISSLDKFKLHRAFVGNYVVTQGNLDLRVEPTWQNFKYDTYLQQLKDAGIARIFCTQGAFDWQGVQGKQGKVMPIRDTDNPLNQSSWSEIGELCRQLAIRYANDTSHLLSEAKVYTGSPTYLTNTPKAGLDLLDAIEIQNEWDFKQGWSGATRTITPEEYAVCFKVCYDAIRTASKTIKIVMGGGISPIESTFTRFLGKLDELYQAEGKPTPNDFYLCFHWYMRNGSSDQGGGTAGITPEEANAYDFGQLMDAICEQRDLLGWYCTETGWASDDSKQSAPILEGYTREQSQGILMLRLALIWGACKYHRGISFWHCANNYDLKPYAAGGVNYRKDAGKVDWSAKPARTICEEFLAKYGDWEIEKFQKSDNIYYVTFNDGKVMSWTDKVNVGTVTPKPTETTIIPPTNNYMELKVVNKKLQWADGVPCILKHADSPESRLRDSYRTAFREEAADLAFFGMNAITCTMRGDDITDITPWAANNPSNGADITKLHRWHDDLKYFIDQCSLGGERGVVILYLGERTNFQSITLDKYKEWIDAMSPIFEDISGHLIFGWEEIGQNMTPQQMADWSNPILSYLKTKLPKCLTMLHNNPGQKPWNANSIADIMCIQETSMNAMGTSATDAFNKGYAVHLHEPYNGFRTSNSEATNLSSLTELLNQAKGITSGYGIFAADYDTQSPDASKLDYLYTELADRLDGNIPPVLGCTNPTASNYNPAATVDDGSCIFSPPNPTNMIVGYSTNSGRSDFKEIINGTVLPSVPVWIEARQVTPTVIFTLSKDGVVIKTQNENGQPYDCHGGQSATLANDSYSLVVKDKTTTKTVTFTVGVVTPPVVRGCTDVNATNYNPNATEDDGSCVYPPTDSLIVSIVLKANGNLEFTAQDGRKKTVL